MTVVATDEPVISGTPQKGSTLHTSDGTWTYDDDFITFAYAWLRCDAAGDNCTVISGATSASYTLTESDVGHTIRSRVTGTEHVNPPDPPPPTGGATLQYFTDFKNTAFGPDHAYAGSGAIFNRKCNPTPSSNGFANQAIVCPTAWADGSGIFEITEPGIGDGLDFRWYQTTPRGSGHGIQLADIGHIIPNSLPADFDLYWDMMWPSADNPSGFPPFSGDPSTDEWNIIIEFTDCGFQSNAVGIANFSSPKPKLYVTAGIGVDNQKRRAKSSWLIQMNQWYSVHYQGKLSKTSTGRVILDAGPRGGTQERIADWSGPTSNPCDGSPYVELGPYGMNQLGRNRLKICNMQNLLG